VANRIVKKDMDKIKSTFANPVEKWRRRNSVENTTRWVGEHDGYDSRPLPRLTWKGFWMGILVSMGGFVFGYASLAFHISTLPYFLHHLPYVEI